MWLINCHTLSLEEVVDSSRAAKYAILSHTWEDKQEVQQAEFISGSAQHKSGWEKIKKTCELALEDGCDFAWVDTCCINKSSSAELTEAINSMFTWYKGAEICYAFLADYDDIYRDKKARIYDHDVEVELMASARWFSRGWTLQELIAPRRVRFYDRRWEDIGTKDSLSHILSPITGIQEDVLRGLDTMEGDLEDILSEIPVARRMSWAAKRYTTRVEDLAYCLLGIFGVNLPLLYGEGKRAFIRLQEEIVRNSNDLLILAWSFPDPNERDGGLALSYQTYHPYGSYCGVFAEHPREFRRCREIVLKNDGKFAPEITPTNKGLRLQGRIGYNVSLGLYFLDINCKISARPDHTFFIYLKHEGAGVFARAQPQQIYTVNESWIEGMENCALYLSKTLTTRMANSLHKVHRHSFVVEYDDHMHIVVAKPETLWDRKRNMFITTGLQDFVAYVECRYEGNWNSQTETPATKFFIVFGYGYGYGPWIRLFSLSGEWSWKTLEPGFTDPSETESDVRRIHRFATESGDWRRVALEANQTPGKIQLTPARWTANWEKWHITAELALGNEDDEPFYVCRVKLTNH